MRASLESVGRASRPPNDTSLPFYSLQLVTSLMTKSCRNTITLNFRRAIYRVGLFCLLFSTIKVLGSLFFLISILPCRWKRNIWKSNQSVSLLSIDLSKGFEIIGKTISALYTMDFYYPSGLFSIHHK